jgi:hypothetical protein
MINNVSLMNLLLRNLLKFMRLFFKIFILKLLSLHKV